MVARTGELVQRNLPQQPLLKSNSFTPAAQAVGTTDSRLIPESVVILRGVFYRHLTRRQLAFKASSTRAKVLFARQFLGQTLHIGHTLFIIMGILIAL